MLQLLKPACLEPVLCNKRSPCSPQLEKTCTQQRRPNTAKNNNKKLVLELLATLPSRGYTPGLRVHLHQQMGLKGSRDDF